jgi:hypothetical protein
MTEAVTTTKTVAQTPADAVVRIEGLGKSFDGRLVLDDVHLEVARGRIVSVIGQSGGKTTLMRCVNLLERPDRGTVEVAGEVVHSGGRMVCRDLPRLRRTVGMVFQRFNLFPHLTAVENVVLAQRKAGVPEHGPVVVVGGGVVGLCTAYYLAEAGLPVEVVERRALGSGASRGSVDRVPGHGNAFAATGHGMLGVTLGPVTGHRLAEYVRTGRRPASLAPFGFGRLRG